MTKLQVFGIFPNQHISLLFSYLLNFKFLVLAVLDCCQGQIILNNSVILGLQV